MRKGAVEKERPTGLGIRLALVASEFNSEVTDKMLECAQRRSSEIEARVAYVCRVPGAYDMPLVVQDLLKKEEVDAVVTLGAVVKGDTKHDEVIAGVLADKLAELSLRYGKPVTLGVSGPSMTLEQAVSRTEEFAVRAVDAAVKLARTHRALVGDRLAREHEVVVE